MTKNNTTAPDHKSADFKNIVDLLAIYSEASHRLDEMQANLNCEVVECIDGYKADYATMQKTLTETETALEVIATRHPEWFKEKKGLKTPYGTVKFTRSAPLVVPNAELSMELIRRDAAAVLALDPENLIRTVEELNLEVLETLTPEQLKVFKIRRETKENFSIVPAKVDLGKAVKEAAEKTDVKAA